jgi:hypothetical protein
MEEYSAVGRALLRAETKFTDCSVSRGIIRAVSIHRPRNRSKAEARKVAMKQILKKSASRARFFIFFLYLGYYGNTPHAR